MRFARPVLLLLAAALPLGVAAAAWHHAGPRSSRSSRAAALRQQLPLPEEGHEIEVRCERVAYGGLGIARTDAGATVMLSDHTVPGELIRALVTRRRRRHVEARTTAVLEPGPASVAPPWSELFASCGGCQLQRMAYAEQLATKRRWVIDAIARCPGGAAAVLSRASPAHASGMGHSATALAAAALEPIVRATVPSPKQTRYRNKATFFFAPSDSGLGLVVGSKAADDAGRVVPIGGEGCPLQAEEADAVLASVAAWARRTALPSFDIRSGRRGEGALWQAVLRTAGGGAGGGGADGHAAPAPTPSPPPDLLGASLDDLFGGGAAASAAPVLSQPTPPSTALPTPSSGDPWAAFGAAPSLASGAANPFDTCGDPWSACAVPASPSVPPPSAAGGDDLLDPFGRLDVGQAAGATNPFQL
mmetsp:Transcript_43862/g.142324  ORF Transcript_43862/g.142324 Transcript_43862/m.142324 type:complete len:418 (+) Transcript_43862:81-1334(+)